jgi:hypothetical protein
MVVLPPQSSGFQVNEISIIIQRVKVMLSETEHSGVCLKSNAETFRFRSG